MISGKNSRSYSLFLGTRILLAVALIAAVICAFLLYLGAWFLKHRNDPPHGK